MTVDYDAELRRHDEVLRRASRVRAGDHVLDIGCGTGATTRRAAREAGTGSALGIDISAPAIERARELADGAREFHESMVAHLSPPNGRAAQPCRYPR